MFVDIDLTILLQLLKKFPQFPNKVDFIQGTLWEVLLQFGIPPEGQSTCSECHQAQESGSEKTWSMTRRMATSLQIASACMSYWRAMTKPYVCLQALASGAGVTVEKMDLSASLVKKKRLKTTQCEEAELRDYQLQCSTPRDLCQHLHRCLQIMKRLWFRLGHRSLQWPAGTDAKLW